MDLDRQLKPVLGDLEAIATRDDLSDWTRERLITATVALEDVLIALAGPECAWCGLEVTLADTGRPRDYCSPACRQAAYRDRIHRRSIASD